MSPTYLSKIERGELLPPAEEKVEAMAEILGQNKDEFLALAGRLPADLPEIIRKTPREMASFLRAAKNLGPSEIEELSKIAARIERRKARGATPKREDADETHER